MCPLGHLGKPAKLVFRGALMSGVTAPFPYFLPILLRFFEIPLIFSVYQQNEALPGQGVVYPDRHASGYR